MKKVAGASTVCPGQHAFAEADGYSVVWWDPSALRLGAEAPFGVRREDLIVKDVPKHVVADGRTRYDSWQLARHDARARGAAASVTVQTVQEWVRTVEGRSGDGVGTEQGQSGDGVGTETYRSPEAVSIINLGGAVARPGGLDFGALVHEIMAQAPFDASPEIVDNIAAVQAQLLAMTEDEARAAAEVVSRLLAHDLLSRARAADARGACRRETPVTCTTAEGTLVEGVVDLAFEEDGVWTVVDYKTDRELAATGEDRYRRQVALYATAIAQATGQTARGVLVRV